MARLCTVCAHPQRTVIDEALLSGAMIRKVARKFQIPKSNLYRHKNHIAVGLVKATEAAEVADADSLMMQVRQLMEEARELQQTARQNGDIRAAVQALRVRLEHLELLAKLSGELAPKANGPLSVTVNVLDQETALKMARVFVERHQPKILEGE